MKVSLIRTDTVLGPTVYFWSSILSILRNHEAYLYLVFMSLTCCDLKLFAFYRLDKRRWAH